MSRPDEFRVSLPARRCGMTRGECIYGGKKKDAHPRSAAGFSSVPPPPPHCAPHPPPRSPGGVACPFPSAYSAQPPPRGRLGRLLLFPDPTCTRTLSTPTPAPAHLHPLEHVMQLFRLGVPPPERLLELRHRPRAFRQLLPQRLGSPPRLGQLCTQAVRLRRPSQRLSPRLGLRVVHRNSSAAPAAAQPLHLGAGGPELGAQPVGLLLQLIGREQGVDHRCVGDGLGARRKVQRRLGLGRVVGRGGARHQKQRLGVTSQRLLQDASQLRITVRYLCSGGKGGVATGASEPVRG
eukprot:scaffold15978_cov103-Isochrysis_galbana.AAC.3